MPQGLDSADRKLLIGAGILFVALVAASAIISPPRITGIRGIPSSDSPAWEGAKGAFLLLQNLGYDVSRWQQPPTSLPADAANDVLILADPIEPPSDDERFAISTFLQNGGRVVATGAAASQFLPGASPFNEGSEFADAEAFHAQIPSPLTAGAPEISMIAPYRWAPKSVQKVVVYGNEDTAAVVTYTIGKGQVIWWADADPLTNGGIRDAGNLAFFLNCVGPAGRGRVLWDEYFHGERGSLLKFFARTPALWGAAQFGLVFLAIVVTYSRRVGPVRPPQTQSRLSPLEFVETLGDLYASAHVAGAAVGIAYQRFRFLVTRKLGMPVDASAQELAKSASEGFGWDEVPLLRTLTGCEAGGADRTLSDGEALELVQQLHDYSARLEAGRRTQNRKGTVNE